MDYLIQNEAMKHKFDVFIQLKQIISPIIEYIILLDRLVFLYENDLKIQVGNNSVQTGHFLVKLFDQSISPRCHALISYAK